MCVTKGKPPRKPAMTQSYSVVEKVQSWRQSAPAAGDQKRELRTGERVRALAVPPEVTSSILSKHVPSVMRSGMANLY